MGGVGGYFGTPVKAKVVSVSQISALLKSNFHGKLSIFKSFSRSAGWAQYAVQNAFNSVCGAVAEYATRGPGCIARSMKCVSGYVSWGSVQCFQFNLV